jgi:hypothetical protein
VFPVVLTPPTMLMGATPPAIAGAQRGIGRLAPMANLAGGATGTVLAGLSLRVYDTVIGWSAVRSTSSSRKFLLARVKPSNHL